MKKVFLFDLDSTITREEILPTIANEIGKGEEMRFLTESTMMGEIPFEESFRARVEILSSVPVSNVVPRVKNIKLNNKLVDFIRKNKDICYIVTGNLDVWIEGLMQEMGMEDRFFCSHALVENEKIEKIEKILKKEEPIDKFNGVKVVAVGDGSNDYNLLEKADVGIGFGGVRKIAPSLLEVCDYAVYTEDKLCEILELIKGQP